MKYSFEKIEDRKSYVWHTEGDNKTLIAITDDIEKAHFLATAANAYKESESPTEIGQQGDAELAWKLANTKDKPFFIDIVRRLIRDYDDEEISLSKLVEELNIMAYKWASQPAPPQEGQDELWREAIDFLQTFWTNDKAIPELKSKYKLIKL